MTRLRNTFLIAAAVLATLLCTVASASARPAPNTDNGFAPATTPPVAPHVASSGMAAWTIALIALSSAVRSGGIRLRAISFCVGGISSSGIVSIPTMLKSSSAVSICSGSKRKNEVR